MWFPLQAVVVSLLGLVLTLVVIQHFNIHQIRTVLPSSNNHGKLQLWLCFLQKKLDSHKKTTLICQAKE